MPRLAVMFRVLPPTLASDAPPRDADVVIVPEVVSVVEPVLLVSLPVMTISALPALMVILPAVLWMKLIPIGRSASMVWVFVVNWPSIFWYS